MNKQELIKKIQSLEGLTNNEKADLLAILRSNKKYGLVWEDKPEDVEKRLVEELPVLSEVKEHALLNNSKAPNHILIEGDNLEALTALSYTHAGKIDVIYIDPPYNTGNKDFKYNDDYVDVDDAYRHSKWLSFMDKRLRIAKTLLSEKSLLFISIGDDELSQLIPLCKQIFQEKNYIETYIWTSTFRPDNSSPILRRNAEFIVCVSKNKKNIDEFRGVVSSTSGMPSLTKAKEKIKTLTFPPCSVKTTLNNGIYKAGVKENGKNLKWELLEDAEVKDGIFVTPVVLKGHSYWATEKKIKEELDAGTEIWIKSETFVPYYNKTKESINRPTKILPPDIVKDGLYANTELNSELFQTKVFNNPKPTTLIGFLINFIDASTILDFFAGSGTTLHATMQLNAEDGGSRQCILVTNNENGICENITYERNRRVINGYTKPNGEVVHGLTNNNLRYYRTAFVGRERTSQNMRELVKLSTDMLCIKNDIYTEAQLNNKKINPNIARYFEENGKQMLVIYCEEAIPQIVKHIASMPMGTQKIKVYLFSPNGYAFNDDFEEVESRVQLCALPNAIYEAYKRILPNREPKLLSEDDLIVKPNEE